MEEKGVKIEGALLVEILYVSADDTMPFAVLSGEHPLFSFRGCARSG